MIVTDNDGHQKKHSKEKQSIFSKGQCLWDRDRRYRPFGQKTIAYGILRGLRSADRLCLQGIGVRYESYYHWMCQFLTIHSHEGWSAPALEDMARPNSEPQVTDQKIKALIGSVITLGALAGGLISGMQ